jgi:uncharacterized protein
MHMMKGLCIWTVVSMGALFAPGLLQANCVFINELHYDNAGADTGEAVEIAGPAGLALTGWKIALYNGSDGTVYNTKTLSGIIPNLQAGYGLLYFSYPSNSIQNGSPDGIALVDSLGGLRQFLSYEGSFTGASGAAAGVSSVDIGVFEPSSTNIGYSLQLAGTGNSYSDFTWASARPNTFGAVNMGQTFRNSGHTPEPSSVCLLCLGLLGAGVLRRRRA